MIHVGGAEGKRGRREYQESRGMSAREKECSTQFEIRDLPDKSSTQIPIHPLNAIYQIASMLPTIFAQAW